MFILEVIQSLILQVHRQTCSIAAGRYIRNERQLLYGVPGVTEVYSVRGIYIRLTPESIGIISFLSHLVRQWKWILYCSELLMSQALSDNSSTHTKELILQAGKHHIVSPYFNAAPNRTAVINCVKMLQMVRHTVPGGLPAI
jgi:hypothetical protein